MDLEILSTFNLVGGTALSLKLGHRISIDLDLFSNSNISNLEILNELNLIFKERFVLKTSNKVGIFCLIDNIKVDIIHYDFELIYPLETIENIRMASIQDIAAMKIQAILGRGAKKDFFDLYEILKDYSLMDIIKFHKLKYPAQKLFITIPQTLTYFDDANESEDPVSLTNISWEEVKLALQKVVNDFLR